MNRSNLLLLGVLLAASTAPLQSARADYDSRLIIGWRPGIHGFSLSNDAGFESDAVMLLPLTIDLVRIEDDSLMTFHLPLLNALSYQVLSTSEQELVPGRIMRAYWGTPLWELAAGHELGLGFDFDWFGVIGPGNIDSASFVPENAVAGDNGISFGASVDYFYLAQKNEGHLGHAWATIGALLDPSNTDSEDGGLFTGFVVRLETEWIWHVLDGLALMPGLGVSYYGYSGVERLSSQWRPSSAVEWAIKLGAGYSWE